MRKGILILLAFARKPSQGYTMHGKIDDKNNYRKHVHMYLSKALFYNSSRFRLGAWKLNVDKINLRHINISKRICNYCDLWLPRI